MALLRALPRNRISRPPPYAISLRCIHITPHHHQHPDSTINPSEIKHFNALASSWWDPQGPSRLLHLMNPLRHSFLNSCHAVSRPAAVTAPRSQRILDVGCGGGIFAESAARLPTTRAVTAIDPSSEVLAIAQAHARRDPLLAESSSPGGEGEPRLSYLNTGIEGLPVTAQGFDTVTLFEVIEHVASPSAFLTTLTPHVRPGGWLVMSTIARTWTSWMTTKFVAEDVLRMVPRGTHDWSQYVNEEEIRAWFMDGPGRGLWESPRAMGVMYVPGIGWKEVSGGENWGNYFFGVRRKAE